MRKTLKFVHTLGGIGLLGGMISIWVMLSVLPDPTADFESYRVVVQGMDRLARWVLLPSLCSTVVAGLLVMAVVPGFHDRGWVWLKLATGVLMFEGSLMAIQGPLQREYRLAEAVAEGRIPIERLGADASAVAISVAVVGLVAVANVALGVWRPRLSLKRTPSSELSK